MMGDGEGRIRVQKVNSLSIFLSTFCYLFGNLLSFNLSLSIYLTPSLSFFLLFALLSS